MKNLLKFFLYEDGIQLFDSMSTGGNSGGKLKTEDLVVALEILAEAEVEDLSFEFDTLLDYVFDPDIRIKVKKMWSPEFSQRTGRVMEVVFRKALVNPYEEGAEEYQIAERCLMGLRSSRVDFNSYMQCKTLYEKLERLLSKLRVGSSFEVEEIIADNDTYK